MSLRHYRCVPHFLFGPGLIYCFKFPLLLSSISCYCDPKKGLKMTSILLNVPVFVFDLTQNLPWRMLPVHLRRRSIKLLLVKCSTCLLDPVSLKNISNSMLLYWFSVYITFPLLNMGIKVLSVIVSQSTSPSSCSWIFWYSGADVLTIICLFAKFVYVFIMERVGD